MCEKSQLRLLATSLLRTAGSKATFPEPFLKGLVFMRQTQLAVGQPSLSQYFSSQQQALDLAPKQDPSCTKPVTIRRMTLETVQLGRDWRILQLSWQSKFATLPHFYAASSKLRPVTWGMITYITSIGNASVMLHTPGGMEWNLIWPNWQRFPRMPHVTAWLLHHSTLDALQGIFQNASWLSDFGSAWYCCLWEQIYKLFVPLLGLSYCPLLFCFHNMFSNRTIALVKKSGVITSSWNTETMISLGARTPVLCLVWKQCIGMPVIQVVDCLMLDGSVPSVYISQWYLKNIPVKGTCLMICKLVYLRRPIFTAIPITLSPKVRPQKVRNKATLQQSSRLGLPGRPGMTTLRQAGGAPLAGEDGGTSKVTGGFLTKGPSVHILIFFGWNGIENGFHFKPLDHIDVSVFALMLWVIFHVPSFWGPLTMVHHIILFQRLQQIQKINIFWFIALMMWSQMLSDFSECFRAKKTMPRQTNKPTTAFGIVTNGAISSQVPAAGRSEQRCDGWVDCGKGTWWPSKLEGWPPFPLDCPNENLRVRKKKKWRKPLIGICPFPKQSSSFVNMLYMEHARTP